MPTQWADQCNIHIDVQQVNAEQLITAQNPHEVSCGGSGGDGGGGGDTNGGEQATTQGDWCSIYNQIEFEET